jgi:hypothetical protein
LPPAFSLLFGNVTAYVPVKCDETGINRLERLVLGKPDFLFDFGNKVSLDVVKGHGVYRSFPLGASLKT